MLAPSIKTTIDPQKLSTVSSFEGGPVVGPPEVAVDPVGSVVVEEALVVGGFDVETGGADVGEVESVRLVAAELEGAGSGIVVGAGVAVRSIVEAVLGALETALSVVLVVGDSSCSLGSPVGAAATTVV